MRVVFNTILFGSFFLNCVRGGEIPESELGHPVPEALAIAREVCGEEKIGWLEEFLIKAEADRLSMTHKGKYIGWVSRTTYKGEPHFVIALATSAMGIRFCNCSGNTVQPKEAETH